MERGILRVAAVWVALIGVAQAQDVNFDEFFPRRSNVGKTATGMKWSANDRYLAYRWNGIDEPGMDLYVFDTQSGQVKRLTTPETFRPFDKKLPRALQLFKENLEKQVKAEGMAEDAYREFLQEERKKNEARKEPDPAYNGPSEFAWANKGDSLLVTYAGDVYRMELDGKIERLTATRESENQADFTPDDSGFTFRRGDGVYLLRFGSSNVWQLNPELPNKLSMGSYRISPDGTKLMITSQKDTGPDRMVEYISYRERFAQVKRTERGVADDKFTEETYVFLYDISEELKGNFVAEQEPWEIMKVPAGEEFWYLSFHEEPWSPDSTQLAFVTYKRDQQVLDLLVADLKTKKVNKLYSTKHDGEHTSPSWARPFFTPDGKKIVVMLEGSGYRHAFVADPAVEGATQLTRGNFEVYPLGVTPDGKTLIVHTSKESPARYQVYGASMETGELTKLSSQTGMYNSPTLNHAKSAGAGVFQNWTTPRELVVVPFGKQAEQTLTDSHRKDRIAKLNTLKPEIFSYQNRNGQTVYGFMFKPEGWKATDKRPLMVYVYGGPLTFSHSVTDGDFNSTSYWFAQYLTRRYGMVTVTIDPRGQSGYGAVFGKANWEQPGKAQTEDLVDGVKFLVSHHGVDPARVGINGWSFGGFQTQMCLFTAPETFTLGIAGAGPTEWQNYNTWYTGGVIGQTRDGKPEDLDKYSLTHLAKNLRSPLMLLHGVEDDNVLFQDTIKVYRKLLQYGKGHLVELSIDPTGGHGMGGDMSNHDRHRIYEEFIKKAWRL